MCRAECLTGSNLAAGNLANEHATPGRWRVRSSRWAPGGLTDILARALAQNPSPMLLDEPIGPAQLAGAALLLAGVWLAERKE